MDLVHLICLLVIVVTTAYLLFNNYELRKANHNLSADNSYLFNEKSDLAWQLNQAKHEVKQLKAEFCTGKNKKVCHVDSLEKN